MNYLSIDMKCRIFKDGALLYEGSVKAGAIKFALNKETLKKRALQNRDYREYHIEGVPDSGDIDKHQQEWKRMLATVNQYGNTISCETEINPFLDYLEASGVKAAARWKPKTDGIRGYWLIEAVDRSKSV